VDVAGSLHGAGERAAFRGRAFDLPAGRQFFVRGALRYALNLSLLCNFFLFVTLAWSNLLWFRATAALTQQVAGGSVFEVSPEGRTVRRAAAEYATGGTPVEARALAREVTRLISEASAAREQLASANFTRARAMMTAELQRSFAETLAGEAAELEKSGLYKLFIVAEGGVHDARSEEIPAGHAEDEPGYRLIVRGRIEAYRLDSGQPIARREVGYYVRVEPDRDGRTEENPTGLRIAALTTAAPVLKEPVEETK